jgi:hypothetical protein
VITLSSASSVARSAPAGAGRPRLGIELCERAEAAGRNAGFATQAELRRFHDARSPHAWHWGKPTLIVVDNYAASATRILPFCAPGWRNWRAASPSPVRASCACCWSATPIRRWAGGRGANPSRWVVRARAGGFRGARRTDPFGATRRDEGPPCALTSGSRSRRRKMGPRLSVG